MNSLINKLDSRSDIIQEPKRLDAYTRLQNLLTDLEHRTLPAEIINEINSEILILNKSNITKKTIVKVEVHILGMLETQLNLVPKDHYRRKWSGLGMAAFGVPIGIIFGFLTGNVGFMGAALPVGLVIRIAVGTLKDKKALHENRQLAV
jgi:hypothetical protein